MTNVPEPAAEEHDPWNDLQPVLDEELSRLPDKYRAVIVLCDLEGRTRKEAARQLGCPEGTVAGRLVRAGALLAKRLTRRGVVLSSEALAAVLSETTAAAVPVAMVSSTVKAASLFVAGRTGVISVEVAAIVYQAMQGMDRSVGIEPQRQIAARADLERDAAPHQFLDQGGILDRAHAVADTGDRQVADGSPYALRPAHLAGWRRSTARTALRGTAASARPTPRCPSAAAPASPTQRS